MKKILLVDDSPTVRKICRRIVDDLGCEALEAKDGHDALEMIEAHPDVDAVLLDWNMPVMDGLEFLKALRSRSRSPQPVVVMCTTENETARIVEAMQAGANEYIMKPFTEDVVRGKLEETGVL